jgi:ankyrin repeat protein
VAYLVSAGADVNAQDYDGASPLHLSVVSSNNNKSSRITKQLLFCGADRGIKNKQGEKAIDLVD